MSAGYMRRCAGKKRHEKYDDADNARKVLMVKHAIPVTKLDVYRCDQCLGWHVGGSGGRHITWQRRPGKRPNKRMRGRV